MSKIRDPLIPMFVSKPAEEMARFSIRWKPNSSDDKGTVSFFDRYILLQTDVGFNHQLTFIRRSKVMTLEYNATVEVFELTVSDYKVRMHLSSVAKDETIARILAWMEKDE